MDGLTIALVGYCYFQLPRASDSADHDSTPPQQR